MAAYGDPHVFGVAFGSEYKSDREFEVLNAHKEALRVKVLRGGTFHTLGLEDVVVGDAVELETGDEIPAELYKAVAEVLVFVLRLTKQRR